MTARIGFGNWTDAFPTQRQRRSDECWNHPRSSALPCRPAHVDVPVRTQHVVRSAVAEYRARLVSAAAYVPPGRRGSGDKAQSRALADFSRTQLEQRLRDLAEPSYCASDLRNYHQP